MGATPGSAWEVATEESHRAARRMGWEATHSDLLGILSDDWSWQATGKLLTATMGQPELVAELPPLGTTTAHERLHGLLTAGVIGRIAVASQPPSFEYVLPEYGRRARGVRAVSSIWERDAPVTFAQGSQGARTLGLLSKEWVLPIMRRSAVHPSDRGDLARHIPGLKDKGLETRLPLMLAAGIIAAEQRAGRGSPVSYALTDRGRSAATIAMLANGLELTRGRPARPAVACDLAGYVRVISRLVELPQNVDGVCELVCDSPAAIEPRLALRIGRGGIAALPAAWSGRASARAEGDPLAWFEALLNGRRRRLRIDGAADLAVELVRGLHRATVALWRQRA